MTNLSGLGLQSDVKENTGEFVVMPAGKYKAVIVSDELKDTKNGNGKILQFKVQIIEGQFAGEIITDNINIINASQQAQAIGQGTLKRICNLCNVVYPPTDTAGLMGKPLEIDIKIETFTSNNTGKELQSNKIRAYGPVTTSNQTQPPKTAVTSSW